MKCISLRHLILVATILFSISSIFADETPPLNTEVGFISMPHYLPGADKVNPIRFQAIQQAASSLGARGGLAWSARNIDIALQRQSAFLDQVFDFNQLLLNHNVLPPVLVESDNNLNLDGNNALRIAEKSYRIIRQARFVTAAPNWRDYLWMRFPKPHLSNQSLLPQSKAETSIWNHFLKIGWIQGCKQADAIFTDNLNRLKRDLTGIVLYRKLLALHMVSAPFVASADLGVTGDANQLRINDQVLRITAQSQMQTNPKKWQPVLVP